MQAGLEIAPCLGADFGAAGGEQGALSEAIEPFGTPVEVLGAEYVFAKTEVAAQGLGDVGVGGGQFGEQGEQLDQGGVLAAITDGQTPTGKPRALSCWITEARLPRV